MQDVIKINQEDNVAVALRPVAKGETIVAGDFSVTTLEEIPQGHKVALKPIKAGGEVVKYGFRIGFAKEDIPHLFERFYRGQNAGAGGIGIGLSLSKEIVERQNGTIRAKNKPDAGAFFEIRFYGH